MPIATPFFINVSVIYISVKEQSKNNIWQILLVKIFSEPLVRERALLIFNTNTYMLLIEDM